MRIYYSEKGELRNKSLWGWFIQEYRRVVDFVDNEALSLEEVLQNSSSWKKTSNKSCLHQQTFQNSVSNGSATHKTQLFIIGKSVLSIYVLPVTKIFMAEFITKFVPKAKNNLTSLAMTAKAFFGKVRVGEQK